MKNSIKLNYKSLIQDFIFMAAAYTCLYIYNIYNKNYLYYKNAPVMTAAVTAAIIIIYVFPLSNNEDKHIYENKKALIPYVIIHATLLILILTLNNLFGLNNSTAQNFNKAYFLLIELCITLTIFICYFFKIKLNNFCWKMPGKSLALVILVYIIYELILNFMGIYKGIIHVNNIFSINFITKFTMSAIINSLYPGFFEEVLFRGFLISGLRGFGFSDDKCNIIQSIIFGIGHVMSWGTATWVFMLSTASQVMLGYVLGKMYFKTKSLLPCILFHGLIDAM
ncbi:MAG: hypothetical protein K0R54_1048 [Clostridiaceae bacterium]|jgi:membrane protease YdiL (CAAX protease family)|nr:hypothetical protein [Clostridiaceae bacterium]